MQLLTACSRIIQFIDVSEMALLFPCSEMLPFFNTGVTSVEFQSWAEVWMFPLSTEAYNSRAIHRSNASAVFSRSLTSMPFGTGALWLNSSRP